MLQAWDGECGLGHAGFVGPMGPPSAGEQQADGERQVELSREL